MLTPSYSYKHHNIWCLVSDFLTHWPFHQTLLFAHHWCINAAVSCLAKSRYTCKSNHAGWTHGTREATSPTETLHAIFWFCRVTWWTCKKQNLKKENMVQTFITLYQDSTEFLANYGLNKWISMFFVFYFKKIQALLLVYYRYTVIFHCYLIQDKKKKQSWSNVYRMFDSVDATSVLPLSPCGPLSPGSPIPGSPTTPLGPFRPFKKDKRCNSQSCTTMFSNVFFPFDEILTLWVKTMARILF